MQELAAYDQFHRVALVGHNPDFRVFCSVVIGRSKW